MQCSSANSCALLRYRRLKGYTHLFSKCKIFVRIVIFFGSKILLGSQQAQNFLVFENRSNRTDFIAVLVFGGLSQN